MRIRPVFEAVTVTPIHRVVALDGETGDFHALVAEMGVRLALLDAVLRPTDNPTLSMRVTCFSAMRAQAA